jgi:hypothetical protein
MTFSRRDVSKTLLGLAGSSMLASPALAFDGPFADVLEGGEDFKTAIEAYTFGYPLITMEMTRRVVTNVAEPVGTRGPWARSSSFASIPTPASAT